MEILIINHYYYYYYYYYYNLRKDDVRQWWHTINTMSGRAKSQPQFTIERDGQLYRKVNWQSL